MFSNILNQVFSRDGSQYFWNVSKKIDNSKFKTAKSSFQNRNLEKNLEKNKDYWLLWLEWLNELLLSELEISFDRQAVHVLISTFKKPNKLKL